MRRYKDHENPLQMVYQIIAGYFTDDIADELTKDPIFTTILEKESLVSQPTLELYDLAEEKDCHYAIQLKMNNILRTQALAIQASLEAQIKTRCLIMPSLTVSLTTKQLLGITPTTGCV